MDARIKKIGVIVGALALAGALSAGAVALAQSTLSTPSPTVSPVPAVEHPELVGEPGRRRRRNGRSGPR